MYTIKATVFFEDHFWMAVFERDDSSGYSVARKIFGDEPTDPELYEFVQNNYFELKFSSPQKNIKLIIQRKNPKRISREVRKLMKKTTSKIPMTRAEEAMKMELEKNKKIKKTTSAKQKRAAQKAKFTLKQIKKKKKHKGQ